MKIGRRPQVGHFQRAAFAIIQQKRRIGYRGGSLALDAMGQRNQCREHRQRAGMPKARNGEGAIVGSHKSHESHRSHLLLLAAFSYLPGVVGVPLVVYDLFS
jgi:hypothetical protein